MSKKKRKEVTVRNNWEGLKHVINYLGCTKNLWLTFKGKKNTLVEGFCNSDWASQKHRHSILGYTFHFGMGAVTWSSKKQNIIALSSMEAEYIVQTHAAKEVIWLQTVKFKEQARRNLPFRATTKERLPYPRTTNSIRIQNISTCATISFVRRLKMAR
jgi:hypothetical protein